MIKNRKGLVVEALMRIIIAAVLVFIVFKIGMTVAESIFGSGPNTKSFENFVNKLNSNEYESKTELLTSEPIQKVWYSRLGFLIRD